jgi:hypothetical protein
MHPARAQSVESKYFDVIMPGSCMCMIPSNRIRCLVRHMFKKKPFKVSDSGTSQLRHESVNLNDDEEVDREQDVYGT